MSRRIMKLEKQFYTRLLSNVGVDSKVAFDIEKFKKLGWNLISIPEGIAMGKASFEKLINVSENYGDNEIVITNTYSFNSNNIMIGVGLNYYEFKEAISDNLDFSLYDVTLIGKSGEWFSVLQGFDGGYLLYKKIA